MIKKPRDNDWSGITLPWMAVGYEVMQTPLQILTFYNAIANDGRMVKPQFIKEIRRRGKVIKSFPTEVLNESICSRETIDDAKTMLEGVITDGTGRNLRNSTYRIAGKTGTARIANGKYGYKYEGKYSYQASFCGYFPAENPKYSCIVVVNAPSKNVYYGNQVAGPIFRDIADKVYASSIEIHENLVDKNPESWARREDGSSPMPYVTYGFQDDLEYILSTLDIPTDFQDMESTWAVAIPKDSIVSIEVRRLDEDIEKGKVPNVIGMTAQDAIFVLENAGLRVRLVGGGMIIRQSIKAGSKIYSGSEIILELS
jgi:cell division protein FtsI (penicillin-binding protein 3)